MNAVICKPSRLKRFLQNLALFGVVFLVCMAVMEVVLRFCGYGNLEIYQPDPKLYWRLKPNQDCYTKVDHKPVHINSHGTRGPEFQIEKPANTIRILSLGDSQAFGWGLTDEETYSRLLERLLQAYLGATRRVEVINGGVNGWSYPQMMVYLRDVALEYKPDFVIVGEANLWTQFSEKSSPEFVKKFMVRVWLKNCLRRFATYHFVIEVQLKHFYEQVRLKFIPVDPARDPLFKDQQKSDRRGLYQEAIENLCVLAQTNGGRPIMLYLPSVDKLVSTNCSAMRQLKEAVCEKFGVPLVNLAEELDPARKNLYLDADPVHPNALGNEIIAHRLFEVMTNQLAQ